MKKVFSKEKFLNNGGTYSSWVEKCEGLTKEEINKLGFTANEKWMVEIEDDPKGKKNEASIDLKVNVDDEGLEDTVDILREATDLLPNITIRNNEQVYVTINYFNTTAKEYYRED